MCDACLVTSGSDDGGAQRRGLLNYLEFIQIASDFKLLDRRPCSSANLVAEAVGPHMRCVRAATSTHQFVNVPQ